MRGERDVVARYFIIAGWRLSRYRIIRPDKWYRRLLFHRQRIVWWEVKESPSPSRLAWCRAPSRRARHGDDGLLSTSCSADDSADGMKYYLSLTKSERFISRWVAERLHRAIIENRSVAIISPFFSRAQLMWRCWSAKCGEAHDALFTLRFARCDVHGPRNVWCTSKCPASLPVIITERERNQVVFYLE